MDENVENLVLQHLRAIRADMADMRQTLDEHTNRFALIDATLIGMKRDIVNLAETDANLSARLDRIGQDITRIKRRLELADAD